MVTNGFTKENATFSHVPVLADAIASWLITKRGGVYLDCTVGQGGHAALLLERSGPDSRLVGLDRDAESIAAARMRLTRFSSRMTLIQGNFSELKQHLHAAGVSAVDGVLFDLGVSSAQLDRPERGMSFLAEGPLDMRMDQSGGTTAAVLVNTMPERDLANLIYQYGEERYSRRIAHAIVQARTTHPLHTTFDLVALIRRAVPPVYRHGRLHYATRTFQALRIAVNQELDVLESAFRDAAAVLAPGARLCVVSFHSLEDRIAKQTIRQLSKEPGVALTPLTKKPIVASPEECEQNPRARSAKLRVAERRQIEEAT